MRKNWLKSRKVVLSFAMASLIGGFLFLRQRITSNVILNEGGSFNFLSLIGLILILCFLILISYSIKHKK